MNLYLQLAITAVVLTPLAAKAENYKLLVKIREFDSVSTSVLTVASEELCEKGKRRVLQKSQWDGDDFWNRSSIAAICIRSQ